MREFLKKETIQKHTKNKLSTIDLENLKSRKVNKSENHYKHSKIRRKIGRNYKSLRYQVSLLVIALGVVEKAI